jgi:hypothetical protein
MFQVAGGSIGLGLTTMVFSSGADFIDGLRSAFLLDGILAVIGFLITLFFVGGRLGRLRGQPAESAA